MIEPVDVECEHCGDEHPINWGYCPHFGKKIEGTDTDK